MKMKIILKDDVPVHQPPRRVSFQDQIIIDAQVRQWLDEDIITPSVFDNASPIVLVFKKDKTKRLCCDYRKLNEKIVCDNFQIILIDEVFEKLK